MVTAVEEWFVKTPPAATLTVAEPWKTPPPSVPKTPALMLIVPLKFRAVAVFTTTQPPLIPLPASLR